MNGSYNLVNKLILEYIQNSKNKGELHLLPSIIKINASSPKKTQRELSLPNIRRSVAKKLFNSPLARKMPDYKTHESDLQYLRKNLFLSRLRKLPFLKQGNPQNSPLPNSWECDRDLYSSLDLLGKGISLTQRTNSPIKKVIETIDDRKDKHKYKEEVRIQKICKHPIKRVEPKLQFDYSTPVHQDIGESSSKALLIAEDKQKKEDVVKPPAELVECKEKMKQLLNEELCPWTAGSCKSVSML